MRGEGLERSGVVVLAPSGKPCTFHFIPYAIDRGYAPATAATALGLMNGLNVVGVIVTGMLADRWGRKDLLAVIYVARGGAYALLLLAPAP